MTQNLPNQQNISMCLQKRARGFTLVEMLVAMAVTLLMMAALARAFAYVGRQIQESRADTQLASDLRDVTTILKQDLSRCSVDLTPNIDLEREPNGYFMYYEGPVTNATSTLFMGVKPDPQRPREVEFPDSKHGDFDDYLAFTATAPGSQWFTGRVEKRLLTGIAADADTYVTLTSKYAEIVYFASPEYVDPSIAKPVYIDVDGTSDFDGDDSPDPQNGFPDRLKIYRRILLIRPDLNKTFTSSSYGGPHLIGQAVDQLDLARKYFQKSDLSVRRYVNPNGTTENVVIANSLADLSKPHNRFAHIREPNRMPRLDLVSPATILTTINLGLPDYIPLGPNDHDAPLGTLSPIYLLSGIRRGEDVLTNNALGFDLQIFDRKAKLLPASNPREETLSPSDAAYRLLLQNQAASKGCFVDLGFPFLAGGSVRWGHGNAVPNRATTPDPIDITAANVKENLTTDFSGFGSVEVNYSSHWVLSKTNKRYWLPIFDTYTTYYEQDGNRQEWNTQSRVKRWKTSSGTSVENGTDLGTNGVDDEVTFNGNVIVPTNGVVDDLRERESLPTFLTTPEAIQVTVRLENPSLRFVRQASVDYRGK